MPKQKKVTISIDPQQLEWLERNNYKLDELVHRYVNELMRSIEKTKEGVVIPAFVKAPSDDVLKEKLKKNPKLRHLVKD